jgi:hypothetical protein
VWLLWKCCCTPGCAGVAIGCWLSFLQRYAQDWYSRGDFPTDFHSGCTNLLSHQQVQALISPLNSYQHLLFVFLLTVILTGVRWNLSVILVCISFMSKDLSISSCIYWPLILLLITTFCNSFVHLLSGLFVLFAFNFSSNLYFLDINPFSDG